MSEDARYRSNWWPVAGWIAIGLALRVAWAWRLGSTVAGWEADGFVLAWVGRAWDAASRIHPPLVPWIYSGAAWTSGVLGMRLACVAVSLACLAAVMDLALVLARRMGSGQQVRVRAVAWVAAVWAVFPTLVAASVRPSGELLMGAVVCELVAALLRLGERAGALRWSAVAICSTAALLTGGLSVALPVAVGVIVFLVPVPALGHAGRFAGAVLAGCAMAVLVQRGPDPGRPFVPDSYAVYGVADLVGSPPSPSAVPSRDPDRRARELLRQTAEAGAELGIWATTVAWAERLTLELLSPRRFAELGLLELPIGVLDLLLRGGLLLFALAVARVVRGRVPSAWPRAGLLTGTALLLVTLAAGATGLHALAPWDMLLLGAAGAGVCQTGRLRRQIRARTFLLGGLLLCTPALAVGALDWPLSAWITRHVWTTRGAAPGAVLAQQLAPPGPGTVDEHIAVARGFMSTWIPTLRLPEAALRHAEQALRLDPTSGLASETYVIALVDNQLMDEALSQAEDNLRIPDRPSENARVILEWVREERRRARAEAIR